MPALFFSRLLIPSLTFSPTLSSHLHSPSLSLVSLVSLRPLTPSLPLPSPSLTPSLSLPSPPVVQPRTTVHSIVCRANQSRTRRGPVTSVVHGCAVHRQCGTSAEQMGRLVRWQPSPAQPSPAQTRALPERRSVSSTHAHGLPAKSPHSCSPSPTASPPHASSCPPRRSRRR